MLTTVIIAVAAATASTGSGAAGVTVAAIVVAAASEILPFTPLRANGVAQMGIQILQVLFPKRRR